MVDNHNKTTGDLVRTLGNELSRHMDHMQDGDAAYTQTQDYRDARKSYSDLMGKALLDYTSFTFAMKGYNSLDAVNTFNGTVDSSGRPTSAVLQNNQLFNSFDPNQIEYRQLHLAEGNLISKTAAAFAKQNGDITPEEGLKRLRKQAMRQIDSDVLHQDGITDKEASKWLGDMSVAFLKGKEGNYDVELFAATEKQKNDHTLFSEHSQNVEANFKQPLVNEANNWANTFINSKHHVDRDQEQSNHSRLNALARVELQDEAFANGYYGANDLIFGFRDASWNKKLRTVNELNAYSRANGIVLNPNDIKRIDNYQFGFNPEYSAAVEAFGLKQSLMRRNSYGYNWGAAEGQRDIFNEATRYATKGSATPLLIFNNGNITDAQLASKVNYELGGYLTGPQQNIIHNAIGSTSTGQSLDLSSALEYTTAKTIVNNKNFVSDFHDHTKEVAKNSTFLENPSEMITQVTTGILDQTGRNWEITFSDDNAPAYMKENAAAGVALDIAVVAPMLKGLRLSKGGQSVLVSDEVAALEKIKLNAERNKALNQKINLKTATTQINSGRMQGTNIVPNNLDDAARVSSRPEWLRRLDAGNDFNRAQSPNYPYKEVYVNKPDGSGYYRLDSYNPNSGEIVSRKFTQFSDVQESTAFNYINEIQKKYPAGAQISNVPTNVQNGLVGQRLQGQKILEVPVQNNPIPQSVIDAANDAGVLIRDIDGRGY